MKRIAMSLMVAIAMTAPSLTASAQGLTDILGSVLEGVLTKSNLTMNDIYGQWTSEGSAVNFQSENFLKKAGGAAAAGLIENKINPYFNKLGLNNAVLTIEADSTFSIKAKKFTLNGSVTSNNDGTFQFNFKAMKMIPLGSMKAYIQKSGNKMDVMFDAKKLMSLITGVAKLTKVKFANTAASLIDSYDGLCIGFKMNKTGDVQLPVNINQNQGSSSGGSGLGGLLNGVLGGSKNNNATTPSTQQGASDNVTTTQSQTTTLPQITPSKDTTPAKDTTPKENNLEESISKIGAGLLNKVLKK